MPRSTVLPWLVAAAVGVALTAPQACHTRADAAPAPADTTAAPVADPVASPAPALAPPDTTERSPLPDGFVRLSDVAPQIAQEIRYATAYNFVGEPIVGYDAAECILAERAATALASVADALARDGLGLKVYDCYRPQRSVRRFVEWANDRDALAMKTAFYPEEAKGRLFSRGYIATRSGHSRGATVDLTLVELPAVASVLTDYPAPDGPLPRCDRPRTGPTGPDREGGGRLHEGDLDMGTAYDCFTPLAATDHPQIRGDARRNRDRLRSAMSAGGFRNYAKEWWHFTLRGEPHPRTHFDFPVE